MTTTADYLRSFRLIMCMAIALCMTSTIAVGQNDSDAEPTEHFALKEKLEAIRQKHQLPALWGGVFHLDGRNALAATGVRRWNSEPGVSLTDPIHLGSCTKAMTAALIGQLCSEGKLRFDMTLHEIFPAEIAKESSWSGVTVQDLLKHQSGLPANVDWWKLMEGSKDVVEARRSLLLSLSKRKRPQKPTYVYSNCGYALLGHIIEKTEGRAWEESMRVRITQPLHMHTIGFGPILSAQSVGESKTGKAELLQIDVPFGHTAKPSIRNAFSGLLGTAGKADWTPVQIDNAPAMGPAGSAHATLNDWAKFTLVFADPKGNERLNISADVWKKLLESEAKDGYAGGWIVTERSWAGGRAYTHAGSNTTWYCVVFVAPEKNVCLLAATNAYSAAAVSACDEALVCAQQIEL